MKIRKTVAALGIATLGVIGAWASPASASVSQGYIAGSGVLTDDWGDEGPISTTKRAYSGATLVWQHVLQADGFLGSSGDDCRFGPNTDSATRAWQRWKNLDDDGEVGPLTFGKADDNLRPGTLGTDTPVYHGRNYSFTLTRAGGVYYSNAPDIIKATYAAPGDCA
ncbi:MAG: peptidoglycan-binding domain-containing protein [Actinoplanes sp.]